ncbi:hypothetical protein ACIHFB_04415 [Streptomyces sp. NPDC051963]
MELNEDPGLFAPARRLRHTAVAATVPVVPVPVTFVPALRTLG